MYCFAKLCRLCTRSKKVSINLDTLDSNNIQLRYKLLFLFPEIAEQNDDLPKFICKTCHMRLSKAYKFKKRCIRAHEQLIRYLKQLQILNSGIKLKQDEEDLQYMAIENKNLEQNKCFKKCDVVSKSYKEEIFNSEAHGGKLEDINFMKENLETIKQEQLDLETSRIFNDGNVSGFCDNNETESIDLNNIILNSNCCTYVNNRVNIDENLSLNEDQSENNKIELNHKDVNELNSESADIKNELNINITNNTENETLTNIDDSFSEKILNDSSDQHELYRTEQKTSEFCLHNNNGLKHSENFKADLNHFENNLSSTENANFNILQTKMLPTYVDNNEKILNTQMDRSKTNINNETNCDIYRIQARGFIILTNDNENNKDVTNTFEESRSNENYINKNVNNSNHSNDFYRIQSGNTMDKNKIQQENSKIVQNNFETFRIKTENDDQFNNYENNLNVSNNSDIYQIQPRNENVIQLKNSDIIQNNFETFRIKTFQSNSFGNYENNLNASNNSYNYQIHLRNSFNENGIQLENSETIHNNSNTKNLKFSNNETNINIANNLSYIKEEIHDEFETSNLHNNSLSPVTNTRKKIKTEKPPTKFIFPNKCFVVLKRERYWDFSSVSIQNYMNKKRKKIRRQPITYYAEENPENATEYTLVHPKNSKLTFIYINDPVKEIFLCTNCDQNFNNSKYLFRHLARHVLEKRYKCTKCDYKSFSSKELKFHIARNHVTSLQKIHQCEVCNKRFALIALLNKHKVYHYKNIACDICAKKFSTSIQMIRHRYTHSDKKIFGCSICDWKCKTPDNLWTHIRRHHKSKR